MLRYYSFSGASTVILLGAGAGKEVTPEICRQAGAVLYQQQRLQRLESVALRVDGLLGPVGAADHEHAVQAFLEGYLLASYRYEVTKAPAKDTFDPKRLDILGEKYPGLKKAIDRAAAITGGVLFARTLGDRPGNYLTPTIFAQLVSDMARKRKLKVSVAGRAQLEREKMNAFLGVARGSEQEPKMITLEYRGGKKAERPIVLVGKGVTFDSGGISIKPPLMMEEMKWDMMGAGTVVGVMQAIADLKVPRNVIGIIGATENLPDGAAQKPGDVVVSASGKTIEVINTDAEGRLVLCDLLHYAHGFKPQAIIDIATLTGAVLIALGTSVTGVMGNHPGLIRRLRQSGRVTGERVWELPILEEHEEDLKTPFADIRNVGNRNGGSSKGGAFLKAFVDDTMPWVHCDIAGSAWDRKDLNYAPPRGASGVPVRLLAHLVETWSPLPEK